MRRLDDTELAVLEAILKLGAGKGDLISVAQEAKLTVAMTIDVRNYLMREGYLMETARRCQLTEEGVLALRRQGVDVRKLMSSEPVRRVDMFE